MKKKKEELDAIGTTVLFYNKVLSQYREYKELKKAYEKLTGSVFVLPAGEEDISGHPGYDRGWTWKEKILFILREKGELNGLEIEDLVINWENKKRADIKNSIQTTLYNMKTQNEIEKSSVYNGRYKLKEK